MRSWAPYGMFVHFAYQDLRQFTEKILTQTYVNYTNNLKVYVTISVSIV